MDKTSKIRIGIIVLMVLVTIGFFVFFTRETLRRNQDQTTTLTTMPTSETTTSGEPSATTTPAVTVTPTTTEVTVPTTTTGVTATPTPTTTTPWQTTPGSTTVSDNYQAYDNTVANWWYRRPEPTGQHIKAGTNEPIINLLNEYNGIWQQNTDEKVIYLTMDEGYEYGTNTTKILNTAAAKNVPITFFITGDYLNGTDASGVSGIELVRRMINEGHLVANHTWKHPLLPQLLDSQGVAAMVESVSAVERVFQAEFGFPIAPYLRPPGGAYSERTLKVLEDMGYRAVFWSFAYRDWYTDDQPVPAAALAQVIGELHPGSVILLHTVSTTNVEILPAFIDQARGAGYRFERLDRMP